MMTTTQSLHPLHREAPILITGGTGFAGSHLVEALIKQQYQNIHVTSLGGKAGYVGELLPPTHIHQLDLLNAFAVQQLIEQLQPAAIYHLAALATVGSSFEQGQRVLEDNLKLQLHVLEAIRHCVPQARVLIVGSGMEYDLIAYQETKVHETHPLGPVSPYAVSKVMQDLLGLSYAYSYKLNIVRCRPFNHIGERQTTDFAIPSFAHQIAAIERGEQQEIKVGNLDAVRDFTDVKDVVNAYILLMEKGKVGDVYNVGSGKGHSMQEVLDLLRQLSRAEIPVVKDPSRVRPLDVPAIIADISKIQTLGWQPTIPLESSLKRILEEWRTKA